MSESESKITKKTPEEIESLKRSWFSDPCWDIEETEGFEAHRDELLEYHRECDVLWKAQAIQRNRNSKEPLTKRELIAAMCLQGLLANPEAAFPVIVVDPANIKIDMSKRLPHGDVTWTDRLPSNADPVEINLAAVAVRHADALLAELGKEQV